MINYRDPLVVGATEESSNSAQMLADHLAIQKQILRELMKRNPDVLTSVVVQNTNHNLITDTQSHMVRFEIGGMPVTIYKLLIFSTFTHNIVVSPQGVVGGVLDGMVIAATTAPIILDVPLSSVSVMVTNATNCQVNGPADNTNGALYLFGFTIPDYDAKNTGA